MSSSSNPSVVLLLNNATTQLNRYFGISIFLFGTIGNILNILVLSQKTLRKNPCAWCFLISSIASLISYLSGLSTRILFGWNLDLSETTPSLCKIRGLVVFTFITVTFWLIALATIDRWLSSNFLIHYRQKSTLKNAQRGTIIIICLSIGLYIQMIFCYDANLVGTPSKCYSKSTTCGILFDLSFAIITILFPILLMILFGLKTISNIRQAHRRIHNQSINGNRQENQHKKIDRQLLIMLFFQVIILTILSLPLPIERFHSTFTNNNSKTILQESIDNFVYNLAVLFIYLANGIAFYIWTISGGKTFRKALLNIFKMFRRMIIC
jgi:hypothetical protein